jgi:hypothetical protein
MKPKIQVLQNEDGYEALYVNDLYIEEGDPLQEGAERVLYFLNICKQYGANIEDIKFYYVLSDWEFKNRFSEYNAKDLVRRF